MKGKLEALEFAVAQTAAARHAAVAENQALRAANLTLMKQIADLQAALAVAHARYVSS